MPEYVLSLLYDIVDNTLNHRRHYDLSRERNESNVIVSAPVF